MAFARTSRGLAVVGMDTPLRIDACVTSRNSWSDRIAEIVEWLAPRTVLVATGARSNVGSDIPDLRVLCPEALIDSVDLPSACAIFGCERSPAELTRHLLDRYPNEAERLACIGTTRLRTERMRRTQPFRAALA